MNVEIATESLLAATSASIGEVLTAERAANLPLVGNNILDLVRILPGYRESALGAQFDTFAGTNAASVNTTRDGISVTDGRFNNGVFSTTTINPDLVGEVRLILTPVDAEQGRGNAQIQIQNPFRHQQIHGYGSVVRAEFGAGSQSPGPITARERSRTGSTITNTRLAMAVRSSRIKHFSSCYGISKSIRNGRSSMAPCSPIRRDRGSSVILTAGTRPHLTRPRRPVQYPVTTAWLPPWISMAIRHHLC